MTTKADFYDGFGRHAVWLGSLQGNADPATVRTVACGRLVLDAVDPLTYADAVTDLLDVWADEDHGHGYHPRDGWPWLWPDSRDTDWVFAFTRGRVQITTGRSWQAGPATRQPRRGNCLAESASRSAMVSHVPRPGRTPAPLFTPISTDDEQCTACGATNTCERDSFPSFGGCTDWWERCTACGHSVSGSDISAIL